MPLNPVHVPQVGDAPPLARRTDHHSSHAAADRMQTSGRRQEQLVAVLELVKIFANRTSRELSELPEAKAACLDRYAIARRLPDLEGLTKIRSIRKEGRQVRWIAEPGASL